MKKLGSIALVLCATLTASAQGKFEVKEFGSFKLHSYITADPLGDMSYIIEGNKSVVVLEPAAFHDNIKELGEYLGKLNKPVEKVIANYHAAGFSAFDHSKFVMIEGMPQFVKGDVYSGMMVILPQPCNKMDISQFTPSISVGKDAKETGVCRFILRGHRQTPRWPVPYRGESILYPFHSGGQYAHECTPDYQS